MRRVLIVEAIVRPVRTAIIVGKGWTASVACVRTMCAELRRVVMKFSMQMSRTLTAAVPASHALRRIDVVRMAIAQAMYVSRIRVRSRRALTGCAMGKKATWTVVRIVRLVASGLDATFPRIAVKVFVPKIVVSQRVVVIEL